MNTKYIIAASALSIVGSIASAQETGDITVGAGLSNFGANLEAAYQINPQFRARGAIMGGFSTDFEDDDDGDEIEGEFNLGGAALLADYYPFAGGWRVSGGLFISNTDLNAKGTVDLGTADEETAEVTAKFKNEIAPMVTTGYEFGFSDGWSLTSEIGVIFSGGIDVSFDASGDTSQSDINADEEIQDAIDEAGDINALPYLSIGVSYRY